MKSTTVRSRHLVLVSLALLVQLGCTSEGATAESGEHTTQRQSIVGGITESGWLGVGALTLEYPGMGYQGSFCSGTLIAERWVLTAAHCLEDHNGFEPTPAMVQFYVGADARPTASGDQPAGSYYQADAFYLHSDWDSYTTENDIGLVHLSEPATGVPTYAYNASALDGSSVGSSVLYVGFGVTDGIDQDGGGVKRSASIAIAGVDISTYQGEYSGSGVCFGDSGGPGLLQISGTWRVIGVNSTVAASGADPCKGIFNHTRVDSFAGWVADTIGAPPPDCNTDPSVCPCSGACQWDGSCDNSVCETLSCEGIYDCMGDCGEDQGCQSDCYLQGTGAGKDAFNTLSMCLVENCPDQTGDAYNQCAQDYCSSQASGCFPQLTGDQDCETIYGCMVECPDDDLFGSCQNDCYDSGTTAAQDAFNTMQGCFDDRCSSISDNDAWLDCVYDSCGGEIEGCFPPSNCDLRGGDCPVGSACYPTITGATDCLESNGLGRDASCDPEQPDGLECAGGLICLLESSGDGRCIDFCYGAGDCASDEVCEIPIFESVEGVGVCLCRDDDDDGACAELDCDDSDPDRRPGVGEICDDGKDNDCDGDVDEDCGSSGGGANYGSSNYGDGTLGSDSHTVGLCSASGDAPGAGVGLLALLLGLARRRRRGAAQRT